ncbi:TPA: hypothetical protein ACKRWR_003678 [Proteus mirabilis]
MTFSIIFDVASKNKGTTSTADKRVHNGDIIAVCLQSRTQGDP